MDLDCFCVITVVTCELGQGLTNVTSVENDWRKKKHIWMFLSKQQTADEAIQETSSSAFSGLDLGKGSIGPIRPHCLVYLL